jgi:hypothetical protein
MKNAQRMAKQIATNPRHARLQEPPVEAIAYHLFMAGYNAASPVWRSARAELPEPGTYVLINSWEVAMFLSNNHSNAWKIDGGKYLNLYDVKFWMELPEQPEAV